MAEHSTVFVGPDTQEQFLADRQHFMHVFQRLMVAGAIIVVLILVGMAIFLL
jgi:hypothetical protein